ncbi:uncharacterized protein [Haliotis cracherodii]|uniref:uncharacterized protein n=1 Tax=Haliotis cracherodii TaxID=6455 RepID=UPI0039E81AE3
MIFLKSDNLKVDTQGLPANIATTYSLPPLLSRCTFNVPTLFPDLMDAGSTPTMNLPACLVCLLALLPDWQMAQDPVTGLTTCVDETSTAICSMATKSHGYCSPGNTLNRCRRSCGLCDSTTVSTNGLDTCKDETSSFICSEAIQTEEYCSPKNTNNKCKRSCGLCESTTVSTTSLDSCKDEMSTSICSVAITHKAYCSPNNPANKCKRSCRLCGTVSTPVSCIDDLGQEECADIITANGSYCNSTNKNNQCKMSCGLCGTVSTPVPCRDDLGQEECADIITANGSYCNSTNKNNQCKMSCDLCGATCSDHLPWTLCSELIKKNKFCSQADRNNGCKMSCGLCKTGSTAGTWPSTVTPSGTGTTVAGVPPSPTTLNQTSGNATTVAGVPPSPTTLNQTSGNVTTVAGVPPSPTTLNHTWGNETTVAGVPPSPTTLNQTSGNETTVAGVPPSPTTLNQTSGNETTVAGVPPSPTTLNQTSGNETTVAGVPPSTTTLNQTSGNETTVAGVPPSPTTLNQTSGNETTVAGVPPSPTTLNHTSGNLTTVAGVPPSPTTLNHTSGNVTTDYNRQRMNSSVQLQQNNSRSNHSNQTDESKSVSNDTVRLNVSTGNLALGKPSTQSSTVSGGVAGLANDGKYGTNGTECSHTDPKQSSSWWRVDLQGIYTITSVVILNRKDCCCGALNSVTIDVCSKDRDITVEDEAEGDDPVRNCDVAPRPFSCGEKRVLRCAVNVWGRYVWIKQPMPGMTLCEVEIYGESVTGTECPVLRNKNFPSENFLPTFSTNKRSVGTDVRVTGCRAGQTLLGTKGLKCLPNLQWDNTAPICIENKKNLAYRKNATQSSTLEPGLAANAVDGDVGQYSCSTTKPLEMRPRWTVDLGGHFSINDVIVVNRRDCCCHHLSNITIAVEAGGDLPPVICATNTPEFACGEMRSFTCPLHTIGRRVFIEKPSPTLTLCEVVIQGKTFIAKECPPLISPSGVSGDVPAVQLSSQRRRPGDAVTIRCPGRTSLIGSNLLKCLKSGQWDKQLPICIDMRTDVARWKASSLSTTLNRKGAAHLANDAKFPSDGRPPRCARSRPDDKRPWWRVDLGAVHTVNKVYVVNGIETCNARFDIKVINKNLMTAAETLKYCVKNAEVKGCGQTDQFRCEEGVVGNMVVIEKHSPVLVLCEVVVIGTRQEVECPSLQGAKYVLSSFSTKEGSEVTINKCTDGLAVAGAKQLKCLRSGRWNKLPPACLDIRENLARNKPASMSSAEHFNISSAAMAVDGIFDHSFVGTTCSISHMHDTRPWWQVDLQGIYQVQTVTITSRHDSRCLTMRGIHVVVYGEDIIPRNPRSKGNLCDPRQKTLHCGHTLTLTCKPSAVGRYVRVAKYERGLALCEVVVKGRKQVRTDCPPLEDNRLPSGLFNKYNLNGLQATNTSRSRGTEVRVGCRNNYRPIGHTSLVCQKTGQWNVEPAVCSGKQT